MHARLMPVTPTLIGPNITLRPPRECDKGDRRNCIRSPEEYRMYGLDHKNDEVISGEVSDAWFEKYSSQPFHWVISYRDRCIGTTRLSGIDFEKQNAGFSIGIFDSTVWNKGLGAEATLLALKGAFEVAGLSRVELFVLEFNMRAIACYTKCGFSKEGIIEDSVFLDGKWHREIKMGISKDVYLRAAESAKVS
jgi:[ribosomal protein S5]-alanine N-acetyltransferase